MKWKDITLRQFNLIAEASKIEDETEKLIKVMEIVFGEDVTNLSISDFKKKASELDFMSEPIKDKIPPKTIKVNGREYYTDCLLGRISTAQFIDYQNEINKKDMASLLSVFIIPKGHKYNDGYDMLEVISDIEDLPITTVNCLSFFFKRQLEESLKVFQSYLTNCLKKTDLQKDTRKKIEELVTHYNHMVSYLMYSNSVK